MLQKRRLIVGKVISRSKVGAVIRLTEAMLATAPTTSPVGARNSTRSSGPGSFYAKSVGVAAMGTNHGKGRSGKVANSSR
jgi:hypothetical protein